MCGGAKIFGCTLQPAHGVCISLECFFISVCNGHKVVMNMLLVLAQTIIPWNTYSHFNSYWLAVLFWLLSTGFGTQHPNFCNPSVLTVKSFVCQNTTRVSIQQCMGDVMNRIQHFNATLAWKSQSLPTVNVLFIYGALVTDIDSIEKLANILLFHFCRLLNQCRCNITILYINFHVKAVEKSVNSNKSENIKSAFTSHK